MTSASNNLPISIDYTSRDFYSLREDLISRVKSNLPGWSGTDPADFGVALIEAFAYMGDIANYYIDRVANESYLSTATQRASIIGYANSVGYTVDGYRAAKTTLAFGNSSSSTVIVPAGTVVYVDKLINNEIRRIKFTTDSLVTIPANTPLNNSPYVCTATQGYAVATSSTSGAQQVESGVYGIKLSDTTGRASQSYSLNDNNVTDDSLAVYIWDGSSYVKWTKVTDLTLYGKNDLVYGTTIDENNYIVIYFGDGVSGAIPGLSQALWVTYSVSDGVYGNMNASSIGVSGNFILSAPGYTSETISAITSVTTLTNTTPATGGADPESNAAIRSGASSVASTVLRAVTLLDYENIALTSSNIGKVKAYSTNYTSVTLFVSPKRDSVTPSGYSFGEADLYPGYNTSNTVITNEMTSLLSSVYETVSRYSQIGISLTVSPVYYTPVTIAYNFIGATGYSTAQLTTAISNYLTSRFSYANARISDTITSDAIAKEIISIPGVVTANVTDLNGAVSTTKTLTGLPGQVFVVNGGSITGTDVGISTLSALAATYKGSSVSPTPTFSTNVYEYTYSVANAGGNNIFVVTPTTADANATITVAGAIVASGSPYTLAPLEVGFNAVTITVVNFNGGRVEYKLFITRTS